MFGKKESRRSTLFFKGKWIVEFVIFAPSAIQLETLEDIGESQVQLMLLKLTQQFTPWILNSMPSKTSLDLGKTARTFSRGS